ncbi:MAG: LCP family protein [Treponemataceae bacterium]|nr:LCP family protein [Treponemataceae bacterium]
MQRRRLRDEQKGILLLASMFAIVVAAVVYFSILFRTDTVSELISEDNIMRVLFVVDDGDQNALFSAVLIYYPVSKKAAVVNIPGNTAGIYQSIGRVDRIDTIYREKGLETYKSDVESLVGVTIPFSIVVHFADFVRLVDMLGGMRVFIAAPVDVVSEEGERWLLPSGAVTLDGDKAAMYLRYRLPEEGDADVQERYRKAAVGFFTMLHERRSFIFGKSRNFLPFYKRMSFNLSDFDDSFELMSLLSDVDSDTIIEQSVMGSVRIMDGQPLLFPRENGAFIKDAVKQSTGMLLSNSGTEASRIYVLEIQNGTTVQGLAHNTSIIFQGASYDVLSAVNADSNDYEETVIIDHIGNAEVAGMIGSFIHCDNIIEDTVDVEDGEVYASADVDFTIILGKDFDGRYVRASR